MSDLVIDAPHWDSEPLRRILLGLLHGPVQLLGPGLEAYLREGAQAGLWEHDHLEPFGWAVRPTLAGHQVALCIAHSAELCAMLDVAARVPHWGGVHLGRLLGELDMREGGSGRVGNWRRWVADHDRQRLTSLPRRGLDGTPSQIRPGK